jgi:hypothetical protein
MQNRLRGRAFWARASSPGASSRTGLASTGLLSPCEWPVPVYGENRSGYLDDASIKAARCRPRQQPQRVLCITRIFDKAQGERS